MRVTNTGCAQTNMMLHTASGAEVLGCKYCKCVALQKVGVCGVLALNQQGGERQCRKHRKQQELHHGGKYHVNRCELLHCPQASGEARVKTTRRHIEEHVRSD